MPNLRYQYVMNEPFAGGFKDAVQPSHEKDIHTRKVANAEYDKEEERQAQMDFANENDKKELK
jgi:hypothetical protein